MRFLFISLLALIFLSATNLPVVHAKESDLAAGPPERLVESPLLCSSLGENDLAEPGRQFGLEAASVHEFLTGQDRVDATVAVAVLNLSSVEGWFQSFAAKGELVATIPFDPRKVDVKRALAGFEPMVPAGNGFSLDGMQAFWAKLEKQVEASGAWLPETEYISINARSLDGSANDERVRTIAVSIERHQLDPEETMEEALSSSVADFSIKVELSQTDSLPVLSHQGLTHNAPVARILRVDQ